MTGARDRPGGRRPARAGAAALALTLALVVAACGGGADEAGSGGHETPRFTAQIASYELVANRAQRFIVGLVEDPEAGGRLVSFGTVQLRFDYIGSRAERVEPAGTGPTATATFRPIPGQAIDAGAPGPRLVEPAEGVGVYGADGVRFDRPGFWQVTVTARIEDGEEQLVAPFEVLPEPRLPFPGSDAPRTANAVVGTPGVRPEAIDSRARDGAPVPDPSLHRVSVADAIAAGRPVLVVVSTPVYCVSRFCGPITEAVEALAGRYQDRMAFVHLEVWEDFQAQKVSPAAAEWIVPRSGGDANEPWTFLVGRDGRVVARWDNVATEAELEAAVEAVLA